MLVNPYYTAHKNRGMLKGIAMEVKITNSALPINQHDTDSAKSDPLYALIEKFTLTIQEQNTVIQGLKTTIQELRSDTQEQKVAFQNQTQKVEELENRISELMDSLEKKESELSESKELVKT
ncbi:hypothetical protein, partial [Succinimonas amylolytica]